MPNYCAVVLSERGGRLPVAIPIVECASDADAIRILPQIGESAFRSQGFPPWHGRLEIEIFREEWGGKSGEMKEFFVARVPAGKLAE